MKLTLLKFLDGLKISLYNDTLSKLEN